MADKKLRIKSNLLYENTNNLFDYSQKDFLFDQTKNIGKFHKNDLAKDSKGKFL